MTRCYWLRKKWCYRTIYKLIEIGRCYGMEMNVEKTTVIISRQPFPVKLMIDQKQPENVGSFKYLGSM
jgi:hypothetical protein